MDQQEPTRRRFAAALGGTTLVTLAGCLSDTGGDDPSGDDPTDTESMDDGMTDTADGMTDTADGMDDDMTESDDDMDDAENGATTTFDVVVENVSDGDTIETMGGSVAAPVSPGVYAVQTGMAYLFTPGEAASDGLEALAEDGMPGELAEEVAEKDHVVDSGTFATPSGMNDPGPLKPGETYEFSVEASVDHDPALSLATMFVQSNDLFYAPEPEGVPLFEDGEPMEGEVTDDIALWDAGTEKNQPPGEGGDQAPRQDDTDTGDDEMATVRRVDEVDDGYDYPAVDEVLRVRVSTM